MEASTQPQNEIISTQEVLDDLMDFASPTNTVVKKRKNQSNQSIATKKQKTSNETGRVLPPEKVISNALSHQDGNDLTYLQLLMSLWDDDVTLVRAPEILKKLITKSLIAKEFGVKRHLYLIQQGILNILKSQKQQGKELVPCSLKRFVSNLCEDESYTTFTTTCLTDEESTWIMENYIELLQERSPVLSNTAATSTLSTIAVSATAPAVACSADICEKNQPPSGDGILDELFQATNSNSSIGLISQSISKRNQDSITTWSSPGERGFRVVKLDTYDYGKICDVSKDQWWKHSTFRSTFLTLSPADPKEVLISRLLTLAATDLRKVPGAKKEEKVVKSSSFYGYGQRHQ